MRRSKFEIKVDILEFLLKGEVSRYGVLFGARLAWRQMEEGLEDLVALGLVEKSGKAYRITEQGRSKLEEVLKAVSSLTPIAPVQ